MKVREQLLELRERIVRMLGTLEQHSCNITVGTDTVEFLDRLLAERPYEPGDDLLIDNRTPVKFCCVYHGDDHECIVRLLCDDYDFVKVDLSRLSRKPKTRRLKPVPVEKIEQAKKASARENPCTEAFGAALDVCDWLANPENWEDEE